MFGRAKKILASELMYARDMEEQEAIDFLENLLEDIGQRRGPGGASTSIHQARSESRVLKNACSVRCEPSWRDRR